MIGGGVGGCVDSYIMYGSKCLYMMLLSLYRPWLELLAIFDVVFTIVSFWMFDFVMDA